MSFTKTLKANTSIQYGQQVPQKKSVHVSLEGATFEWFNISDCIFHIKNILTWACSKRNVKDVALSQLSKLTVSKLPIET